ncbi:MAG: TIGR03435 family protein [Bryobacterales bacterium]|nr:TIGR03435 family protein [Bryobacterales bacterium]MBV9397750.1 TIGR03435 family protein [Bryobacterales bacterium]
MKWLGVALLPLIIVTARPVQGQTDLASAPDWQTAAGGTMAFEVASVREDKGALKPPSFALSSDAWFQEPNGRFHADFALPTYIQFAYKLRLTPEERRAMLAKLPQWVGTDRFDIEATAPLHATKDQYRLMMQALLAERFGLKLHFEKRELPVVEMVLAKPGKPGPKLTAHALGQSCDEKPKPETWPKECYSYAGMFTKDGMWRSGSRATSMDLVADFVGSSAGADPEMGRRVVDQTGLTGLWDFTLETAPAAPTAPQDGVPAGQTLIEAIQDQLGIKLKPARAVVSVMVIDHLERPSEN